MADDTAIASNVEIVREYTRRVFNEHDPDLASEYVPPDVKWHGGTLGTVEGAENLVGLVRGFTGAYMPPWLSQARPDEQITETSR
jgi:hypothetical protein